MKIDTFLNWILDYVCRGLRDRDSGELEAWVDDLIFDSPEEEARVKARFRKWMASGPSSQMRQRRREAQAAQQEEERKSTATTAGKAKNASKPTTDARKPGITRETVHSAAVKPRLTVSAKHERSIRKYARFLNVKPQDFLNWNMDDITNPLENPSEGMLGEWVHGLIQYETPEEEQRVKARFAAWESKKLGKNLKHGSEA